MENKDMIKVKTACNTERLVSPENEELKINYNGKLFYFCEQECIDEFRENPEEFLRSDHFLLDVID